MKSFFKSRLSKKKMNSKKGSMTYFALLMSGAMLIGGMLFMVDVPLKLTLSNEMVNNLDNVASSAITTIDESKVKEGVLIVDEVKAKKAAYQMIAERYNLMVDNKNALTLTDSSPLSEVPVVDIRIANKPKNAPSTWKTEFTFPNQQKVVATETSVIVYAKMTYKSLVRKMDDGMVLERIGASQVAFPKVKNK